MKAFSLVIVAFFAMVVAPVFADINIDGEFVFGFNSHIADPGGGNGPQFAPIIDTGDITITGTAANGNASIVFGLDFAALTGDTYDPGWVLDENFLSDLYLDLNLTGALGLEAPVDFSMSFGRREFGPNGYLNGITGFSSYDVIDAETSSAAFIGFELGILDTVTLTYAIDPLLDEGIKKMFAGATLNLGVLDAEVFYNISDAEYDAVGSSFVVTLEPASFGAGAEFDLTNEIVRYGVSARTGLVPRTDMGVAFFGSTADDEDLGVGLDASYEIFEGFKAHGALIFKDLTDIGGADQVGFELSASYDFAPDTTLYLGYASKESGYNAVGDLNEGAFFLKVSTVF